MGCRKISQNKTIKMLPITDVLGVNYTSLLGKKRKKIKIHKSFLKNPNVQWSVIKPTNRGTSGLRLLSQPTKCGSYKISNL